MTFKDLFKKWCKDTKRSGGVLVGKSIHELMSHLEKHSKPDTRPSAYYDALTRKY